MIRGLAVSGGLCLGLALFATGCAEKTKTPANKGGAAGSAAATQLTDEQKEIQAAMAELPEADRKLAEAQGTCPVSGEALGSMGMPYKVTVKGRDVFLCCDGCKPKTEKEPDEILKILDAKKVK